MSLRWSGVLGAHSEVSAHLAVFAAIVMIVPITPASAANPAEIVKGLFEQFLKDLSKGPLQQRPATILNPQLAKVMQQALQIEGYYDGIVDGKWGKASELAWKTWKGNKGLRADSTIRQSEIDELIAASKATAELRAASRYVVVEDSLGSGSGRFVRLSCEDGEQRQIFQSADDGWFNEFSRTPGKFHIVAVDACSR